MKHRGLSATLLLVIVASGVAYVTLRDAAYSSPAFNTQVTSNVDTHPAIASNTAPVFHKVTQARDNALRIVDYGQQPSLLNNPDEATDASFSAFAEAVSRHLAEADISAHNLSIIRVPVRVPDTKRINMHKPSISALCIDSPWAQLTITEQGAKQVLGGSIFWNERQFLRDRSKSTLWPSPPLPFTQSAFNRHAAAYAEALTTPGSVVPDTIPNELQVLFENAPQSTRGPFRNAAVAAMGQLVAESANAYTEVVGKLIHHCAATNTRTSLTDLGDLRAEVGPTPYTTTAGSTH